MTHLAPKIVFFRIKDNAAKLQWICSKVHETVKLKKRLMIFAPNEEAAKYIDMLLWRLPEESFLPHSIVDQPSKEWIAISMIHQNLNQAHRMLNLCSTISPIFHQFEEVYEMYDDTQAPKQELSQKKLEEYKAHNGLVMFETSDIKK